MTTINDRKTPVPLAAPFDDVAEYFLPTILMETDYFPFGMQLFDPATLTLDGEYRFGFNTQEKNDELKGPGIHYTAPHWEYDPRVFMRWNVDPRANPAMSTYSILGGNPIFYTDHLGDSLNVSEMLSGDKEIGTDYTQQMLNDWQEQGGLFISYDETGGLSYTINEDSKNHSEIMRFYLMHAIDGKEATYHFHLSDRGSGYFNYSIFIDPNQVNSFIDNVSQALYYKTLGFGMTAFHEILHSPKYYGNHKPPKGYSFRDYGWIDNQIEVMNAVRFELTVANLHRGIDYGTRMSYQPREINGVLYLPFDAKSSEMMRAGENKKIVAPNDANLLYIRLKR